MEFLLAFFSVATDSFASLRNFSAVSGQAGTLLIACLGGTFVILMGSIDLSLGAVVLLGGAMSVTLLNHTPLGFATIPAVALIGDALGLVNGLVYTWGRIPSFIVTLGTLSVFGGLALTILDGRAIPFDLDGFDTIAIGQFIPHLPNIAFWALVAWAVVVVIAARTRFGRTMYLIGGGETVARTAGVPVTRYKIYAFVLSGGRFDHRERIVAEIVRAQPRRNERLGPQVIDLSCWQGGQQQRGRDQAELNLKFFSRIGHRGAPAVVAVEVSEPARPERFGQGACLIGQTRVCVIDDGHGWVSAPRGHSRRLG